MTQSTALVQQAGLTKLQLQEREWLIQRLPPHHQIHALSQCLNRDHQDPGFVPWTRAFHPSCNRAAWVRDMGQCLRLGTQALLQMMRTHVNFLSDRECSRARAPYKLVKDILRQAFWRVDPQHSGYTSMAQFMQVGALSSQPVLLTAARSCCFKLWDGPGATPTCSPCPGLNILQSARLTCSRDTVLC